MGKNIYRCFFVLIHETINIIFIYILYNGLGVVSMKKRVLITGGLIFIFGFALILFFNQPKSNFENVTIPEDELIDDDDKENGNEEAQEEGQNQEEKDEPVSTEHTENKQISQILTEAVKNTLDFFSNRETHVVALGDSLTQGVGDSKKQGGYVGILNRAINEEEELVTFDNFGIRGYRSDQLLEYLDDPEVALALENTDIVLITIGANDIMQVFKSNFTNLKLEDFKKERVNYEVRLRQIFSKIKEINPNASIYLLGFYNPFDKYFKDIEELSIIVEEWNGTGKRVAEENNETFIPTADLFDDPTEDVFAEDNFHPNDLGYQRMAKRVLEYLTNQ